MLAHVVVDRPEARNALTPAMYFGIRYAIDHVNREPDLAGLLITGTGDVFIPGGELGGRSARRLGRRSTCSAWTSCPFDAVRRSLKPIVCAVNGICQGGGMMIAMLSDVAVASERATFRAPELFRGIADTHYAQILPRQIGPARARDMLLTGRKIDAATAPRVGPRRRGSCRTTSCMAEAVDALEQCCRAAPEARAAVKRSFHEYYGHYDRMAMEASIAGDEIVEGWQAFTEKRSPSWVPRAPPPRRTDLSALDVPAELAGVFDEARRRVLGPSAPGAAGRAVDAAWSTAIDRAERPVVLAGPGVVLRRAPSTACGRCAERASLGVLNTWGAKGVFDWRSPHHLATAGLQAWDFERGGLADADLIIATGPRRARGRWPSGELAPVVDVLPSSLASLAERDRSRAQREIAVPPLRADLAAITQAGWARDRRRRCRRRR